MRRPLVTLALAAGLLAAASARAADPEAGHELAQAWCSSCHVVEPEQGRASDIAPPFEEIANDPSKTPPHLEAWLAHPHPPMPNFNLSRDQIADLIAYIQSLKTE